MWFLVASKAPYQFNIKVTIVATNISGTLEIIIMVISNLVITTVYRVLLEQFVFFGGGYIPFFYHYGGTQ